MTVHPRDGVSFVRCKILSVNTLALQVLRSFPSNEKSSSSPKTANDDVVVISSSGATSSSSDDDVSASDDDLQSHGDAVDAPTAGVTSGQSGTEPAATALHAHVTVSEKHVGQSQAKQWGSGE